MRKLKLKRLSDKATQLVSSRARIQTQAEYDSRNLTLNYYTSASQNVLDTVDMKGRENADSSTFWSVQRKSSRENRNYWLKLNFLFFPLFFPLKFNGRNNIRPWYWVWYSIQNINLDVLLKRGRKKTTENRTTSKYRWERGSHIRDHQNKFVKKYKEACFQRQKNIGDVLHPFRL